MLPLMNENTLKNKKTLVSKIDDFHTIDLSNTK
jgi:hypothetical protein